MAKLYALTSGYYSDYGIEALCSDKESAEELAGIMNKKTADHCAELGYEFTEDSYDYVRIEEFDDGKEKLRYKYVKRIEFDEKLNVTEIIEYGVSPTAEVGLVTEKESSRKIDTGKTEEQKHLYFSLLDFKQHEEIITAPVYEYEKYISGYSVIVNCKTRERAIKVARERIAEFLANKNGI